MWRAMRHGVSGRGKISSQLYRSIAVSGGYEMKGLVRDMNVLSSLKIMDIV